MSNKPLKKSDLSKDWMKPRQHKNIDRQSEYHLIITEGIETEPKYFKGLKHEISRNRTRPYKKRIEMRIEGEGCAPLMLLAQAQKYVEY